MREVRFRGDARHFEFADLAAHEVERLARLADAPLSCASLPWRSSASRSSASRTSTRSRSRSCEVEVELLLAGLDGLPQVGLALLVLPRLFLPRREPRLEFAR